MSIRIADHISKISKRIISFRIWISAETAFQMDQPGLIDWMSVVFCPVGKLLNSYGVITMAGDGLQNYSLHPFFPGEGISSVASSHEQGILFSCRSPREKQCGWPSSKFPFWKWGAIAKLNHWNLISVIFLRYFARAYILKKSVRAFASLMDG